MQHMECSSTEKVSLFISSRNALYFLLSFFPKREKKSTTKFRNMDVLLIKKYIKINRIVYIIICQFYISLILVYIAFSFSNVFFLALSFLVEIRALKKIQIHSTYNFCYALDGGDSGIKHKKIK